MKIIFCGSSAFSIPSLEYIYNNENVIGLITQPDKPQGRGLKIQYSLIKNFALTHQIPLFQPLKLNEHDFIQKIITLHPDLILSVSYGKIFPVVFFKIPKLGCINIHPSLLPGYRGPSPIRWVLINGEKQTGVTSHLIDEHVDAGKIISQIPYTITPTITYDELYDALSKLSVEVIKKSINFNTTLRLDDPYIKKDFYARKFEKNDYSIDWNKNSIEIYNLIRGLFSKPSAQTLYECELIKIYKAEIVNYLPLEKDYIPGEIVQADGKNGLIVKTGDGFIKLLQLQRRNKKCLDCKDFLNGMKLKKGEVFQNGTI